jgi:RNA polymerase sigma-70 factor (ECF subfamily)
MHSPTIELADVDARLAEIYRSMVHEVRALCARILGDLEAEETTQEVFLEVWRRAGAYDPSRGSVRGWVLSIARSRAIDRRRRRRWHETDGAAERVAVVADADPIGPRERDRVRAALMALPDTQREVLMLAYFGGLTHTQIAAATGAPVGTVKTRLRAGVRALRAVLANPRGGTASMRVASFEDL